MDRVLGVYTGVVVDTTDPQNRGRVRLQIPQLSGTAVTGWATRACHGIANIGDIVTVSYDGSDSNYPVYWPMVREYVPPVYVPPNPVWKDVDWLSTGVTQPTDTWARGQYSIDLIGLCRFRGILFKSSPWTSSDNLICSIIPDRTVHVEEIFALSTSNGPMNVDMNWNGIVAFHDAPSSGGPTWVSLSGICYDMNS